MAEAKLTATSKELADYEFLVQVEDAAFKGVEEGVRLALAILDDKGLRQNHRALSLYALRYLQHYADWQKFDDSLLSLTDRAHIETWEQQDIST